MNSTATVTSPARLSGYNLRSFADNLTAFDEDSAFRQIDLHIARGDIGEADAAALRNIVTNPLLGLY